MDRFSVDGREIYCWPGALSVDACKAIAGWLKWPVEIPGAPGSQSIVNDQPTVDIVTSMLVPVMDGAPRLRWLPSVTLTRAYKVPWHKDPKRGADWKICLYLDEVFAGGTVFRSQSTTTETRPPYEQGTIVMFDIEIEHRTDDYNMKKMRRVLGLRAVSASP